MIHIAICDDEIVFTERLKAMSAEFLEKNNKMYVIQTFTDGAAFLASSLEQYDLVLLDVNMNEYNGIDLAKTLRKTNSSAILIYISAFLEFAHLGYSVKAFNYLLKSSLAVDFPPCMKAVLQTLASREDFIALKLDAQQYQVPLSKLLYLESQKRKVLFHINAQPKSVLSTYEKLSTYDSVLSKKDFVRIHQSYLVNMDYIAKIERYAVTLCNGEILNVSKSLYAHAFQKYLFWKGTHEWNI